MRKEGGGICCSNEGWFCNRQGLRNWQCGGCAVKVLVFDVLAAEVSISPVPWQGYRNIRETTPNPEDERKDVQHCMDGV